MSTEIPHNALIAVCDGGKSWLLRNTGTETSVVLQEERYISASDRVDGQPQETDEPAFARQIVRELSALHDTGGFSSLVLAADPRMLGHLRSEIPKSLEQAVILTLTKDLTNTPMPELARILMEISAPESMQEGEFSVRRKDFT